MIRWLNSPPGWHAGVFSFCLVMLAAAIIIHPSSHERLSLFQIPLPPLCGFRLGTGLPCPGCGLTRSWVLLAHGDWIASWHRHRLGWLTMFFVFLQALRHGMWLSHSGWREKIDRAGSFLDKSIILLGLLLLLNWIPVLIKAWH